MSASYSAVFRFLLTVFCLFAGGPIASAKGSSGKSSGAPVSVRGYTRKDGTYVQPHMRSAPNGTKADNWSTLGNVNPYTGKVGTRPVDDAGLVGNSSQLNYGSVASGAPEGATTNKAPTYYDLQKQRDAQRAEYWRSQGYNFDPKFMTAYTMDRKVEDIKRADFWKAQGYHFNPSYMTAYSMDRKVEDHKRAAFWKSQGYVFDPTYMTAYSMDRKVEDIKRAEYWKQRGLEFDSRYMSAHSMDLKAAQLLASRR